MNKAIRARVSRLSGLAALYFILAMSFLSTSRAAENAGNRSIKNFCSAAAMKMQNALKDSWTVQKLVAEGSEDSSGKYSGGYNLEVEGLDFTLFNRFNSFVIRIGTKQYTIRKSLNSRYLGRGVVEFRTTNEYPYVFRIKSNGAITATQNFRRGTLYYRVQFVKQATESDGDGPISSLSAEDYRRSANRSSTTARNLG